MGTVQLVPGADYSLSPVFSNIAKLSGEVSSDGDSRWHIDTDSPWRSPLTEKMPLAKELLLPLARDEHRRHKLKRLVQHPNSYFMDVKCPGCYRITTVFSHAQTVVVCSGCSTVLCQSTGGRARLTEGCSFRKKQH